MDSPVRYWFEPLKEYQELQRKLAEARHEQVAYRRLPGGSIVPDAYQASRVEFLQSAVQEWERVLERTSLQA